jgi:YD repeat-containing protein
VTTLEHDFVGNRVRTDRYGRAWTYGYDENDNLVTIRSPVPQGHSPAAYTTSILYDDLDRVEERLPATRDLTTPKLEELAIGPTEYIYDEGTGWNPIGRLARVELPFATIKYRYDAQGNVIREDRTVALISGAAPPGNCGNFVCEPELGESCITCNQDCGLCAVGCGDGSCQPERGESCTTCPQDCGACPFCGDGACQPDLGENASTCPADCPQTASEFTQKGWCGDGACRGTETPANCPRDCPGGTGFCGDAICQNWEWPQTCCRDCGSGFARQAQCGNGSCEVYIGTCPSRPSCGTCVGASQNSFNCPADCGPVHTCGDGICQWEEDCSSCPQDCGACACGNSVCEPGAGESCETCPQDCGACPAGSESRAIVRSYNALGGLTAVWHADDPTDPSHTTFEYDGRGLPVAAIWQTGSGPQTLARVHRNVSGAITLRTLNPTPILDGVQGATWSYDQLGRILVHVLRASS